MKAYIAGSIFTEGDRMFLEKLAEFCEGLGVSTFLPHRDVGFSSDRGKIFLGDKGGLDVSDVVVVVINLHNDIGAAWEVGYAYAKGKKIIGFVDDKRIFDIKKQLNIMYSECMDLVFSFEELRGKLK